MDYDKDLIKNHKVYKDLEAKIKEQRQVDAIKDKIGHKAATIARFMGESIRAPGMSEDIDAITATQKYLNFEVYDDTEEDSILTSEDGFGIIGWHFDALNHGSNTQVTLYIDNFRTTITHNGRLVFEEMSGDLVIFLPNKEWEAHIAHWYKKAEKLKINNDLVEKQAEEKNARNLLQNIRHLLKMTWGI